MTRPVQALANVNRRMPEAGRIRIGEKHGKAMRALDKFRFTTPDKDLAEQVARLYGGTPRPWNDPKANPQQQWEVYGEQDRINVLLPPNCISTWYELWAGGGRVRQCDGVSVTVAGHDDLEQVPCICNAKAKLECAPYTRITMIIPDLPLRGTWSLSTKGWNALSELPGMVDLVHAVSQGGMVQAQLGISKRQKIANGRKSHFVVPTITLANTVVELASGQASVAALAAGTPVVDQPALSAPPSLEEDDGVIEAELVDEREYALNQRADSCADRYGMDRRRFWSGIMIVASDDLDRVEKGITMIENGYLEPVGFDSDGKLQTVKGPAS